MRTRLSAGILGAALVFLPIASAQQAKKEPAMSRDMREAIAFERYKDAAAARQARIEARRSRTTVSEADRRADRPEPQQGRKVTDPGPSEYKKANPPKK
jgi:hypothetical protein